MGKTRYGGDSEHLLVDYENYLDFNLDLTEKGVIIERCNTHLGKLYPTVKEYYIYKFFQNCGNELDELGIDYG